MVYICCMLYLDFREGGRLSKYQDYTLYSIDGEETNTILGTGENRRLYSLWNDGNSFALFKELGDQQLVHEFTTSESSVISDKWNNKESLIYEVLE